MWRHFILAFCCFTVAVAASERSPAKVRIHHERSTQAELIASVEALGKTHHLKLKKTLMPSVPMHEVRLDDNGSVTIVEISGNETRSYYEDEETGAFLFMNNANTLEGMVSDSVALHYDNNEHTASEVIEKTSTPLSDVSHNKQMVALLEDIASGRLQVESKAINFVVEVVAVADSTLWNYKQSGLQEYMQVYWKMVDRRFRTTFVHGATSIAIRLSYILFTNTTSDSLFIDASEQTFAERYKSRDLFSTFLASQKSKIAPFDIGHLMTRRDLYTWEKGQRYTPYTGTVTAIGLPCLVTGGIAYNTGISEDDGLWGGTLNTVREIGHNLGAYDDGYQTSSSCPSSDGWLMSTVRNSYRTFWFSKCSVDAFINVYGLSTSGCLKTIDNPNYLTYPNYIAGNFRSLDTQCQWATKVSNAVADPAVSAAAQCFLLKCKYFDGTVTKFYTSPNPALDGTPCSTGGFCKDGYCQTSWMP